MKKPSPAGTARSLEAVEQGLGYKFSKSGLLIEALTHRSHHHEFGDSFHNERLEFLGDAVLDLCVTELIMELSPMTDEGQLSKMRSQLVSEGALAQVAKTLGLGKAVRLGKGEDQSGGRERESLLADTLEAVIAALYLDGGMDAVKKALPRLGLISDNLDSGKLEALIQRDSKSRLQEICQSLGYGAPTYDCLGSTGPDHQRRFTMALLVGGKEVLRAEGATKKEATQRAAQTLLDQASNETKLLERLSELGVKKRGTRAASVAKGASKGKNRSA
jgi:ribonuclease-3